MNSKNGNVIRHNSMVRVTFSGSFIKPGAKTFTTKGIHSSNIITKRTRNAVNKEIDFAANSIDFSLPADTNFDENRGTKAEVKAPSANKLRNKLGSLNDTRKASDTAPAPKKLAIIISRINPVIRLIIVKPPKVAIDFMNDIKKLLKM